MNKIFQSTLNTRILPTGNTQHKYIRTDVPLTVTDSEIQWLIGNNITTLVDLRSEEEVLRKPCPLQAMEKFTYHHFPVTGGGGTPKSREHLHQVYSQMLDAQMDKIIDTILNADTGVMYFCAAGKDRTGVVSALLLKHLGISDDIIIDDYMKSKDNLLDMLTTYVKDHPEVDINIIIPQEENITKILAQIS